MKRFVYFLVTIVAIAVGAPYILPGQDGKPMLDGTDLKMPELATPEISLPNPTYTQPTNSVAKQPTSPPPSRNRVNVYRWQDSDGQWHFSNSDPERSDAEEVKVRTNINTMPSTSGKTQSKYSSGSKGSTGWNSATPIQSSDPVSGKYDYSVEGIKQLVDDARNVESMLNERKSAQDSVVGATE